MHYYSLTEKGKDLVKLLDKEYLKVWKECFDCSHEEMLDIAIARVVQAQR